MFNLKRVQIVAMNNLLFLLDDKWLWIIRWEYLHTHYYNTVWFIYCILATAVRRRFNKRVIKQSSVHSDFCLVLSWAGHLHETNASTTYRRRVGCCS
jgi:hypothetical protein